MIVDFRFRQIAALQQQIGAARQGVEPGAFHAIAADGEDFSARLQAIPETGPFLVAHAEAVAVLDPLGANLRPGPDLYPELLRGLAESLADCLG